MADYQRVVDDLRSFLQSNNQTDTELLKTLSLAYAEECKAANQRLRRCEDFLKQELWAEAIQFAQCEPPLLDVVTALDFPERPQMEEVLQFYVLPSPPPLHLATAEELNRVYAQLQPLENLLRLHRRLALLRAPLVERIGVMRRLAKLAKNSTVWGDDLGTFETARIRQLQAELPTAGPADVAAMARELEQSDWVMPPPASLVEQVQKRAGLAAREQARSALENVVGQLNAAMVTKNAPQAQELKKRYEDLLPHARLAADDRLIRDAARPLRWLEKWEVGQAQELELQSALAALEAALGEQADPEDVTRLYHEARDLGGNFPKRVEQRYREYVNRADSARRWREKVILLSVVLGGVIVVLGIVGYLWLRATGH